MKLKGGDILNEPEVFAGVIGPWKADAEVTTTVRLVPLNGNVILSFNRVLLNELDTLAR